MLLNHNGLLVRIVPLIKVAGVQATTMPRKELEQSDIELFREAIGAVKPIKNDRADPDLPRPMAVPVQAQRHEQEALQDLMSGRYDPAALDLGDEISFLRHGLQHNIMRK